MFSYFHSSEHLYSFYICVCVYVHVLYIERLVNYAICDDGFSIYLRTRHILQPVMKTLHPGVTFHYCVRMKYQHEFSYVKIALAACMHLTDTLIQSDLQAPRIAGFNPNAGSLKILV